MSVGETPELTPEPTPEQPEPDAPEEEGEKYDGGPIPETTPSNGEE